MSFDPKWDARYGAPGRPFGGAPNVFLSAEAQRVAPGGRALTIGEGDGRNAVWLAAQGFTVTAVEGSSVGIDRARAHSAEAGVAIDFHCADLTIWTWPVGAFDAVVSIFVHFPPSVRNSVHARAAAALAPGGRAIVECFHPRHKTETGGGPPADMMCDAAALADDFAPLTPALAEDRRVTLNEGPRHQGDAWVARYVGVRSV